MKAAQMKASEPTYDEPIPFPKLPVLSDQECKAILDKLSHGKAIAFDGISDCIFAPENKNKAAKVLKDLWSSNWEEYIDNTEHFTTRLIPLNKVHPKLPTKEKFRPISISSAIIKLLEARLIPKLYEYLTHRMHRGQTGFVPGQGILVKPNATH